MEKIGVGGVLTFDESPGLAGMKRASSAFDQLDKAREKFSSNLAAMGQSFQGMNLIAGGLAIAGVAGMGGLIHSAIEAKSAFEDMQVVLGSTLGIARKIGFKKGFELAASEMEKLEAMSFKLPTNTAGLLAIYKQIAAPLSVAGAGLEQIRNITGQASIAAKAMGLNMDDIGFGLARIAGGAATSHDQLFRQLRLSGLIRQDMQAEELNAMEPAQRLQLVTAILKKYGEAAEAVGNTWTSVKTAVEDVATIIKRYFIGEKSGLFVKIKEDATKLVDSFIKNRDQVLATATAIGTRLVPMYELAKRAVLELIDAGVEFYSTVEDWVQIGKEWLNQHGLTSEKIGDIGVQLAKVAFIVGTILPLLSMFSIILGPGLAVIRTAVSGIMLVFSFLASTITSIGTSIAAASLPVIGIVAAAAAVVGLVFLSLRRDGESFGQTVMRIFTYIKSFWEGFAAAVGGYWDEVMAPLKEGWATIKEQFVFLMDYLSDGLQVSAEGAGEFGNVIGQIVVGFLKVIATVIGWFMKLVAVGIYVTSHIAYGLEIMSQRIRETFYIMIGGIKAAFILLVNAISLPLRAIAGLMSEVMYTITSSAIGKKALLAVGIDSTELAKTAGKLHDFAEGLNLPNIEGYGKIEAESPEDEVYRKRAARLKGRPVEVKVESNANVTVNAKVNLDSKNLAMAVAQHQVEIAERAGAKTTPWQRRSAVVRASPQTAGE